MRLHSGLVALLPVLLLLVWAPLASAQQDPRVYLKRGIELNGESKLDEALTHLAKYRQLAPEDWRGHVWQALTLLRQATAEKDPVRRRALLEEARAMETPLIKQAGVRWQSPLLHYLRGLEANLRADRNGAYMHLVKAREARPDLFKRYESIRLRFHVKKAFALASMEIAIAQIMRGDFEQADPILTRAVKDLPADDPLMRGMRANMAVVKEGMGQYGAAIDNLRICVELAKKAKDQIRVEEYTATIGFIHLHPKDTKKARAELTVLPADCKNPEVILVRCRIRLIETERDPDLLFKTLAYYREAMKDMPVERVQNIVIDYGKLVTIYITRREAEEHKKLIEETLSMVHETRERHPECPAAYWIISKLYALLGDEKNALNYERLHDRKKDDYKSKARYDRRGRPRCATTS